MRKYFLSCILTRHECFQEWTFFIVHSDERDGSLDIDVAPNTEATVFPPNILYFPLYLSQPQPYGMVGQREKFI